MSAIGTLMATAAVTLGVVAVSKALKKKARQAKQRVDSLRENAGKPAKGPIIDLEKSDSSGVWSMTGRGKDD